MEITLRSGSESLPADNLALQELRAPVSRVPSHVNDRGQGSAAGSLKVYFRQNK